MRSLAGALGCMLLALVACGDDPNALTSGSLRRSGTGAGADTSSDSTDTSEVVVAKGSTANESCFATINAYRAKQGLPPYDRWTAGESCADGEAASDSQTEQGHGSFGRCGELAQNECPGTPGAPGTALPQCLSLMWREGAGGGHFENMTSTTYTKAACGVFVTSQGTTWSVQNFR